VPRPNAAIGALEALLFTMLGKVVDWVAEVPADRIWTERGTGLLALAGILLASTLVVWFQALVKLQALASNFAMRLRWVFHRLMLGQSMSFYQDEFAGRVVTRVMQTALAVRDVWCVVAEMIVYVVIYFGTIAAVAGTLDARLLLPFGAWLVLYVLACRWFVPRLGRVAQSQADARSLMTGRIADAYTNISTVKLFSYSQRAAGCMRGCGSTRAAGSSGRATRTRRSRVRWRRRWGEGDARVEARPARGRRPAYAPMSSKKRIRIGGSAASSAPSVSRSPLPARHAK
jgi:ATP-binding cassette subfamily B multidrug efflux pump